MGKHYTADDLRAAAVALESGVKLAEVVLDDGDTADNYASTKPHRMIHGPGRMNVWYYPDGGIDQTMVRSGS